MLSDEQKLEFRTKIHDFIDKNCLFRCNPNIQYFPGQPNGTILGKMKHSNFVFHLRRLTHNPVMAYYTSLLILDEIAAQIKIGEEQEYFQLAGLETASIPLMSAIQHTALKFGISINAFSVRKERKGSGLFHFVDGKPTDAPVVIVDDMINSGNSVRKTTEVCLFELGLSVKPYAFSIMTLSPEPYQVEIRPDHIIDINSIFVRKDFDYTYDPEKYWLPKDCDRSNCGRPDYF